LYDRDGVVRCAASERRFRNGEKRKKKRRKGAARVIGIGRLMAIMRDDSVYKGARLELGEIVNV
jgi:hypothetical protein